MKYFSMENGKISDSETVVLWLFQFCFFCKEGKEALAKVIQNNKISILKPSL